MSYFVFSQDKVAAFEIVATMYIKYILIFRKLEECYDQVCVWGGGGERGEIST